MNLITKEIKLHYLTPHEGCLLTQAEEVSNDKRIFSNGVWLANKGKESEWRNITIAEADAIKAELYALECYNVTASHKANIEQLTTIEEVEAYDYTIGYPEKLVINL